MVMYGEWAPKDAVSARTCWRPLCCRGIVATGLSWGYGFTIHKVVWPLELVVCREGLRSTLVYWGGLSREGKSGVKVGMVNTKVERWVHAGQTFP